MSTRRTLIISLLASLLGYLVVFTTFSVAIYKEEKRPREIAMVSFLGELAETKPSPRVQAVVGEERMPRIQPMVRELEAGPGPSLNKPRPTVPSPQISVKGVISPLKDEERALLEEGIDDEIKENPPEKLHLFKDRVE